MKVRCTCCDCEDFIQAMAITSTHTLCSLCDEYNKTSEYLEYLEYEIELQRKAQQIRDDKEEIL